MPGIRSTFSSALDVGRAVLAGGEVAERWEQPSALELMTVGTLAGHLTRAVTSVNAYLDRDPPDPMTQLLDAPGYVSSIDGLRDEITSSLHQAIRKRSEDEAVIGHIALVERWDEQVADLRERLDSEPSTRTLAALDGRAMLLDDYLVTRMMELVIHTDDLAVSVGLASPNFDGAAVGIVIECLVETARRRHGDRGVLMALSRRERDVDEALRVL